MLVQTHAGKRFRRSSHSVRHLSTEACVVPLESLLYTLLIDGVRSFTRGVEAEKHQHEKHCQRQVWWSSKTLNSARLAARARPGHILQDAARLKSILFQLQQGGVCIMAAHSNRWLLRGKWVVGQSVRCCFPVFGKELTVSFALALGRFFPVKDVR